MIILFYLSTTWVNISNRDSFSKLSVVSFYLLLSKILCTLKGERRELGSSVVSQVCSGLQRNMTALD